MGSRASVPVQILTLLLMNCVTLTGDLASLCLSFSIYKMRVINLSTSFIHSFFSSFSPLNKHLLCVYPGPREELATPATHAVSPAAEIKPGSVVTGSIPAALRSLSLGCCATRMRHQHSSCYIVLLWSHPHQTDFSCCLRAVLTNRKVPPL